MTIKARVSINNKTFTLTCKGNRCYGVHLDGVCLFDSEAFGGVSMNHEDTMLFLGRF